MNLCVIRSSPRADRAWRLVRFVGHPTATYRACMIGWLVGWLVGWLIYLGQLIGQGGYVRLDWLCSFAPIVSMCCVLGLFHQAVVGVGPIYSQFRRLFKKKYITSLLIGLLNVLIILLMTIVVVVVTSFILHKYGLNEGKSSNTILLHAS
jgi:hypothetical protein